MKQYTKFLAGVLVITVLAVMVNFVALTANAASLTDLSDVMTDQTINASSNHTITFTLGTALSDDGSSIEITFPSGFVLTGITEDDVDVLGSVTGELTTAADCIGTEEAGIAVASQVLTIELCNSDGGSLAQSEIITVEIGTNATASGTGTNQITNPSSATSYTISIETINSVNATVDTGSFAVPIIQDGTVDVTATVDPTITFELWNETTDCTSARTNDTGDDSVALGSLPTSGDNIASSGNTGVAFICIDLASNASGGAVIKVASANGQLTGSTGGAIESVSATVAAGTENYGVCVSSTGVVTQGDAAAAVSPYNGICNETGVADSGDSTVGALSTTAANIFTIDSDLVTNVIDVDEITVVVKAAASGTTPAGSYSDTLTFTATATF